MVDIVAIVTDTKRAKAVALAVRSCCSVGTRAYRTTSFPCDGAVWRGGQSFMFDQE
jgi:hypothetical protein